MARTTGSGYSNASQYQKAVDSYNAATTAPEKARIAGKIADKCFSSSHATTWTPKVRALWGQKAEQWVELSLSGDGFILNGDVEE